MEIFSFLREDPETNDDDTKQAENENDTGKNTSAALEDGELHEPSPKRRKTYQEETDEASDSDSESASDEAEEMDEDYSTADSEPSSSEESY